MSRPMCPVCGRDARFTHICRNGMTMDPSLLDEQTFEQKMSVRCPGWGGGCTYYVNAGGKLCTDCEVAQLRASLAKVTAERDAFDLERREKGDALLFHIKAYDLERAAHDETRRALEEQCAISEFIQKDCEAKEHDLHTEHAALARSETRVKAALEYANGRWSEWGDRAERVRDILEGNDNG